MSQSVSFEYIINGKQYLVFADVDAVGPHSEIESIDIAGAVRMGDGGWDWDNDMVPSDFFDEVWPELRAEGISTFRQFMEFLRDEAEKAFDPNADEEPIDYEEEDYQWSQDQGIAKSHMDYEPYAESKIRIRKSDIKMVVAEVLASIIEPE